LIFETAVLKMISRLTIQKQSKSSILAHAMKHGRGQGSRGMAYLGFHKWYRYSR